jgi:hypothetical protein
VWRTRYLNLTVIDTALVGDINERLKLNESCYLFGTVMLRSLEINILKACLNHSVIRTVFLLQHRLPALEWLFQHLSNVVSANEYYVALPRDPAAVSLRKFLSLFVLSRFEPKSKFQKNYNKT